MTFLEIVNYWSRRYWWGPIFWLKRRVRSKSNLFANFVSHLKIWRANMVAPTIVPATSQYFDKCEQGWDAGASSDEDPLDDMTKEEITAQIAIWMTRVVSDHTLLNPLQNWVPTPIFLNRSLCMSLLFVSSGWNWRCRRSIEPTGRHHLLPCALGPWNYGRWLHGPDHQVR